MERKVYRQNGCGLIIGALISLPALYYSGVTAYHYFANTTLVQGGDKFHSGTHLAGSGELLFDAIGCALLALLGIAIMFSVLNCKIIVDDQGILATNIVGRPRFKATWPEVALKEEPKKPGTRYTISAKGSELKFDTTYGNCAELVKTIKSKSSPPS